MCELQYRKRHYRLAQGSVAEARADLIAFLCEFSPPSLLITACHRVLLTRILYVVRGTPTERQDLPVSARLCCSAHREMLGYVKEVGDERVDDGGI